MDKESETPDKVLVEILNPFYQPVKASVVSLTERIRQRKRGGLQGHDFKKTMGYAKSDKKPRAPMGDLIDIVEYSMRDRTVLIYEDFIDKDPKSGETKR